MVAVESQPETARGVQGSGSSGLNTLSEYADIPSAAAADILLESVKLLDHFEGAVDPNLMGITPLTRFPLTLQWQNMERQQQPRKLPNRLYLLYPRSIFGSSPSQSYTLEGITKPDLIMEDVAVFFATFRPPHLSADHNQESLAVDKVAPGSYPPSKKTVDTELIHAVYHPEDDQPKIASWQPDYFLEGIDYFAMPAEVKPSEGDRRALAADNPERKMGKGKKLFKRSGLAGQP